MLFAYVFVKSWKGTELLGFWRYQLVNNGLNKKEGKEKAAVFHQEANKCREIVLQPLKINNTYVQTLDHIFGMLLRLFIFQFFTEADPATQHLAFHSTSLHIESELDKK